MKHAIARLLIDDTGQDLVEYALLAGFIGIAGALVFPSIAVGMREVYESWTDVEMDAWDEPPPPGS